MMNLHSIKKGHPDVKSESESTRPAVQTRKCVNEYLEVEIFLRAVMSNQTVSQSMLMERSKHFKLI